MVLRTPVLRRCNNLRSSHRLLIPRRRRPPIPRLLRTNNMSTFLSLSPGIFRTDESPIDTSLCFMQCIAVMTSMTLSNKQRPWWNWYFYWVYKLRNAHETNFIVLSPGFLQKSFPERTGQLSSKLSLLQFGVCGQLRISFSVQT